MKKLLFSALACVAFAFSGFASNEVVGQDFGLKSCSIKISIIDENGAEVDNVPIEIENPKSYSDCLTRAEQEAKNLEEKGLCVQRTYVQAYY